MPIEVPHLLCEQQPARFLVKRNAERSILTFGKGNDDSSNMPPILTQVARSSDALPLGASSTPTHNLALTPKHFAAYYSHRSSNRITERLFDDASTAVLGATAATWQSLYGIPTQGQTKVSFGWD